MKLTKDQAEFLQRIMNGKHPGLADRKADKARQFCRRNGLATIVMNPRRWVITDAGHKALEGQG